MGDKGKQTLVFLITTLVLSINGAVNPKFTNPFSEEFIGHINNIQKFWTAGQNFHPKTPIERVKKLLTEVKQDPPKITEKYTVEDPKPLPESFDAREKWPNCKSLHEIRDQGNCNSGWAVAAAAIITDRICIYSEGKQHFYVSSVDIATCCSTCSVDCDGVGDLRTPWNYYVYYGVVSGGPYNSTKGCRPYPHRQCNHYPTDDNDYPDCSQVDEISAVCETTCISNDLNYWKDKRKGKKSFRIDDDEETVKQELYAHGPLEATLHVYDDFLSYKSGVYVQTTGAYLGEHAVKIIGWGIENDTKYWLIANSWNENWGDKGFFKILRGENHCRIEDDIMGGEPIL